MLAIGEKAYGGAKSCVPSSSVAFWKRTDVIGGLRPQHISSLSVVSNKFLFDMVVRIGRLATGNANSQSA